MGMVDAGIGFFMYYWTLMVETQQILRNTS